MTKSSKSIWLWLIGGLFMLGVIGSIFGKPSEATPDNQPATTEKSFEVKSVSNEKEEYQIVKRVIDGDTVELENGEKVRYIGINTPESVDPRKLVECFAKEASNKNKKLVEGKKVRLEKDISDRDKYNRLLRYIYLEDGTFINLVLVEQGSAQSASFPPDVKHQEEFKKAEQEARNNKLGLWADNACLQKTTQIEPEDETTELAPQENIQPPKAKPETIPETTLSGIVKKSVNNICHAPDTTYYDRTKNFTPYYTLEACIDSGGRLPLR